MVTAYHQSASSFTNTGKLSWRKAVWNSVELTGVAKCQAWRERDVKDVARGRGGEFSSRSNWEYWWNYANWDKYMHIWLPFWKSVLFRKKQKQNKNERNFLWQINLQKRPLCLLKRLSLWGAEGQHPRRRAKNKQTKEGDDYEIFFPSI